MGYTDADKVDNEKLIAANQTASKQAQKKQKKQKQAKKNTQKKKNKKDITQQNPSEQGQNPSDSADNERHSQKENPSESSTKQVAPSTAASDEPSVQEPVLDQPTQGREKEPQAADAKGGEAQNAKVSPTQEQQAEEHHSILEDEMYADSSRHDENGDWQMIFGVETHPDYRRQGYAEILLNYVIEETRKQKRKGLVLTCKEHMVHYYAKFGFVNEAFDHWIELGSGCCKEKESTVSGSGRTGERGGRSESEF